MQSFRYGEDKIPYSVRRTERKRGVIAIHVESDGRVLIDAPIGVPADAIREAIAERARWVWTHWHTATARHRSVLPREYVSGETQWYLGRRYVLKVVTRSTSEEKVALQRGRLVVSARRESATHVRQLVNAWYERRAKEVFARRLQNLVSQLRSVKEEPALRIRMMRKRWGSCSPLGTLTLNPMLVKAPSQCIDYVLLHELCHLKVGGHGPAFYRLLERHMPQWQQAKDWLDQRAEQYLDH